MCIRDRFFTPNSLVKMIVNVLEPAHGVLLDPACGSGGMFVQTGDFVNHAGMIANNTMTFYGQEKVEYNAKLCLMNMACLLYTSSFEAKKMIVNQLIRRVDVYRGYQLNITFNFDLTPYIEGDDAAAC